MIIIAKALILIILAIVVSVIDYAIGFRPEKMWFPFQVIHKVMYGFYGIIIVELLFKT